MNRQRGVSIVAALFLIIVLAAIGVFAMQIGGVQQHTANLQILEMRAQAAADAGIEWAMYRAITTNTCSVNPPPFVLNEASLQGFTVRVTTPNPCFTARTVAGVATRVYTFTSTATLGAYGAPDFVSRTVTRTVSNAALP